MGLKSKIAFEVPLLFLAIKKAQGVSHSLALWIIGRDTVRNVTVYWLFMSHSRVMWVN